MNTKMIGATIICICGTEHAWGDGLSCSTCRKHWTIAEHNILPCGCHLSHSEVSSVCVQHWDDADRPDGRALHHCHVCDGMGSISYRQGPSKADNRSPLPPSTISHLCLECRGSGLVWGVW